MPICATCQAPVLETDKFCGHCGARLHDDAPPDTSLTRHALNVAEVKFKLGMVYYKKNNLTAAIDMWRDVLALDPKHAEAQDMLRRIEQKTGPGATEDSPS